MAQLREINKTLIGVVKQLESMRSTYRKFHQHEMPVGNPIGTNLNIIIINLSALAKLSGIGIKETGNDSDEAYKNIPIGKSKKGSSVNEGMLFGGDTRSRSARKYNKMETKIWSIRI